jgi:hypothetical protein
MPRFADTDPIPKPLPPVYGYLTHQLLPLKTAVEPILLQIDQLDRFVKIAKNECHFPSEHGLTRDESAAVFLYTMEWGDNSFYQVINRALRSEDRPALKTWFAYLKLFDTAIQKLPTVRGNIWRGAIRDITKNFNKDDEFTWWNISSCSTSVSVIKNFLGPNSTLFLIEAHSGKDISRYTNYPTENEVVLCPGTRFRVVSDALEQQHLHLVQLREINDDTEETLTSPIQTTTIVKSSEATSTETIQLNLTSIIQAYTDKDGNHYDQFIHISYQKDIAATSNKCPVQHVTRDYC